MDAFADRAVGTLSSGEQQRVLLARAFLTDPGLVLLDEPTARLDLGGREAMVAALAELARDPSAPPMVMVTHHVDEIPPGFDHALVLREGQVVAAGPVPETLTSAVLTEAFGLALQVERRPGRPAHGLGTLISRGPDQGLLTRARRRSRLRSTSSASTRSSTGPQSAPS